MSSNTDFTPIQRQLIANLLGYGIWIATTIVAIGVCMAVFPDQSWLTALPFQGLAVTKVGIALVILLPIARLLLLFGIFVRQDNRLFASIILLILFIIALGIVIEF